MSNDKISGLANKPIIRGRLKGNELRKLSGLLDMLYTPSELAKAIGFTRRQVYRAYLPLGCPNEKDETGHIWINGQEFRKWYRAKYRKQKLDENEAYCLACKCAVPLINPIELHKGNYRYWSSKCPNCGKKLSKAITNARQK